MPLENWFVLEWLNEKAFTNLELFFNWPIFFKLDTLNDTNFSNDDTSAKESSFLIDVALFAAWNIKHHVNKHIFLLLRVISSFYVDLIITQD